MDYNKLMAALSYFSVLFAPFILPIIVYFITKDHDVKQHAKRSLLSHLIPLSLIVVLFIIVFSSFFTMSMSATPFEGPSLFMSSAPFVLVLLYLVVYTITLIWNIVQGVKVLR